MCKDVCRLPPLSSVSTYKLLLVPPKFSRHPVKKRQKYSKLVVITVMSLHT